MDNWPHFCIIILLCPIYLHLNPTTIIPIVFIVGLYRGQHLQQLMSSGNGLERTTFLVEENQVQNPKSAQFISNWVDSSGFSPIRTDQLTRFIHQTLLSTGSMGESRVNHE